MKIVEQIARAFLVAGYSLFAAFGVLLALGFVAVVVAALAVGLVSLICLVVAIFAVAAVVDGVDEHARAMRKSSANE